MTLFPNFPSKKPTLVGALVLSAVLPAALSGCKVKLRTEAPAPLAVSHLDPAGAVLPRSTIDVRRTVDAADLLAPAQVDVVFGLVQNLYLSYLSDEERVAFEKAVEEVVRERAEAAAPSPSDAVEGASEQESPQEPGEPSDGGDGQDGGEQAPESGEPEPVAPAPSPAEGGTEPPESQELPDPAAWPVFAGVPQAGGDYPEPGWVEREGERAYRLMFFPGELQTSEQDGQLVLEAEFEVAAALARFAAHQRGTPLSCACDGASWCGGRERPLKKAKARWTLTPTLDKKWQLTGEPEFTFEMAESCKVFVTQTASVDLTELIEVQFGLATQDIGRRWVSGLQRSEIPSRLAGEVWDSVSEPTPFAHRDGWEVNWQPRGVAFQGLSLTDDTVALGLQLQLRPVLVETIDKERLPLPPPAAAIEPTGINVLGEISLTTEELAAPLAATFKGRRFPSRPSSFLEVLDVSMYGAKQFAIVQFAMNGSGSGDIHFLGRMNLDEENDELFLSDVVATESTESALAGFFDEVETWSLDITRTPWIDLPALKDEITRTSRWSLGPAVRTLQGGLQETLGSLEIPETVIDMDFDRHSFLLHRTDAEAARVLTVISTTLAQPVDQESADDTGS